MSRKPKRNLPRFVIASFTAARTARMSGPSKPHERSAWKPPSAPAAVEGEPSKPGVGNLWREHTFHPTRLSFAKDSRPPDVAYELTSDPQKAAAAIWSNGVAGRTPVRRE